MAAEIYFRGTADDGPEDIASRIVQDGQTSWETGYGDGTGHETCVRVNGDEVEIFQAAVSLRSTSKKKGFIANIAFVKPVAMVEIGERHIQPVIGPENNNPALLHVRNIGERVPDSPQNYPFTSENARISFN